MKKLLSILLALSLLAGLAACAAPAAPAGRAADETVLFTDSLGRETAVPAQLTRVAVSGPMAQMVLFALCPHRLAGISSPWDPSAEVYLDTEYYSLPVLGQLYGGQGELNLETLLASGAQAVIDVGEPKEGMAE